MSKKEAQYELGLVTLRMLVESMRANNEAATRESNLGDWLSDHTAQHNVFADRFESVKQELCSLLS